jgi:hypothetical protein
MTEALTTAPGTMDGNRLLDDGFSRCVSQVFVVAAAMSRPGSSCHPEDCQTHFSGLLPVATRMLPVFLPL